MTNKRSDEQRKRQIRAAATRCFVRRGYAATRLLDIAREAGLSKGGVYFHYRAKEQLFQDILKNQLESLQSRWSFEPIADQPADRTLARLVVAHVRTLEDDPDENRLFHLMVTMAIQDPDFRDRLDTVTVVMRDLYAGVIEQGIREGRFGPGDPREKANALLAFMSGLGCYAAMSPQGAAPVEAETVAEMACRMLRPLTMPGQEFGTQTIQAKN